MSYITCFYGLYYQVVIVPIWKKTEEKAIVLDAASAVQKILKSSGVRVKLDSSAQRTPGWKFNFWEMKVCSYLLVDIVCLLEVISLYSILILFSCMLCIITLSLTTDCWLSNVFRN